MKYIVTGILAFFTLCASAQQQTVQQLQETAKTLMQQGDLVNAVAILERAAQQEPANLAVLKDLSFAHYLKSDFAKAIEVAKPLLDRPDVDEQTYQILGMSYKNTAQYKECAKMYKKALKKFPGSGVIYNEYGELMAMDKNQEEAIIQWGKGISADPNYSSNYYNAAMYHTFKNNWIKTLIYGELFLNLESYTARTTDIKNAMLMAYRNLFKGTAIEQLMAARTTTAFEKAVLETLAKTTALVKGGIDMDNITTIRTRFILEWFQGRQAQYPFRLFDQQQYLLREGLFEAYNQWIFGMAINADAYKLWQTNHPKEAASFKAFQESRVFKMPAVQNYMLK